MHEDFLSVIIVLIVLTAVAFGAFGSTPNKKLQHFDKICQEAGGVPLQKEYMCLNPSAIIELKDENP